MAKTRHGPRTTIVSSWDEIPPFASEAEESAFWATHELGDAVLAQMTSDADASLPPPRPRTKPIALRFDEDLILRAKALASRRGKGYQTLLKEFVVERLYEEEQREGIVRVRRRQAATKHERQSERGAAKRVLRPEMTAKVARKKTDPSEGGGRRAMEG